MRDVKPYKRDRVTVYPASWTDLLLPRHAGHLNFAIECWATQLAQALEQVNERLSPEDWQLLDEHLTPGNPQVSPRHPNPGQLVAQVLDSEAGLLPRGLVQHRLREIGRWLKEMSYQQSWAVLTALEWRQVNPDVGEWWTLAGRQER